jgi:plastocyanin
MKKIILAVLFGVLVVAGCTQQLPSGNVGNQTGNEVRISGFAFIPQSITIQKGQTVTWTNEDAVIHQIAADPGQPEISDFSSPNMNRGDTYSYTFSEAGAWAYHCNIHPSMKGTIVFGQPLFVWFGLITLVFFTASAITSPLFRIQRIRKYHMKVGPLTILFGFIHMVLAIAAFFFGFFI